VSSPGLGYTLVASSAGLTRAPSSAFSQFATQLIFTRQPSDGNINTPINAPAGVTVEAQDSNGRPLEGIPITMAIDNNPGGGVLGGTTTLMTGADGRATFSKLTINKQGRGYTLVASSPTAVSSTLTSQAFDQAGVATQLEFVQQPTTGNAGAVITPPVTVQVEDSLGNAVFGSFQVTMGIGVNPGDATLGGTRTVMTNSVGLDTFND